MSKKEVVETPLMKQYHSIKAKYPGALLLFRVGDFYETFGEDAIKASKVLDIVLTKRSNGAASEVELAGFPHHSLDVYLPKLVRAGHRVAICDQLEDPKTAKGIVKRGVTELVTPGVSYNDHVLQNKSNNYLASIHFAKESIGIAFLDISTGEFTTTQGNASYIDQLIQKFNPSELLLSKQQKNKSASLIDEKYNTYLLEDWIYQYDYAFEKLTHHFKTNQLKGFGIETIPEGIIAAGSILHYLSETEHHELQHISSISRIEEENYVWLDRFTLRNLEIIYPQHEEGTSLLEVLDHTLTPMGARLLKKWMLLPLKEKKLIEERLSIVQFLKEEKNSYQFIQEQLKKIGDLERLISKVAAKRINPREMQQLKKALKSTLPIKNQIENTTLAPLKKIGDQLIPCDFLIEKLENTLLENPPLGINQGGLINNGIHPELDELRKIANSGKEYLLEIQQREIERTGISSLKISYNKVFGYYLEVTHSHQHKVPKEWIRKQTLTNAERYITEELKKYEETILHAEDKIISIEQHLFQELITDVVSYIAPIQQNARLVAELDCLCSFTEVASKNNYVLPKLNEGMSLTIKAGRHPVIEKQLKPGDSYIPNDIYLDDEQQQIIIITGPNMAGKSAVLRQTALIVLMAQMGCFVPAESAEIGLVDKIFTRVGASDNVSKGESTFMVEMMETASILNNLSERSLLLMDEIGRGTSTYDGISIAWSIVEYLHNHPKYKPKTLFATHYHELHQLAEELPRVKNFNVSVKEVNQKIIFLRKLQEGGSEHSFGIHVAQLAGVPHSIITRANEILQHLERDHLNEKNTPSLEPISKKYQLTLFEAENAALEKIKKIIEAIDINTLSPVEALLKLNELKQIIEKK